MANPRQAERDMSQASHADQVAARKIAEETSRAARKAADAGAGVARAGADMAQNNAEAMEQVWQSSSEMAAHLTERSMDQLARAFGIGTNSGQHAAQQSARNVETVVQSGTILAGGFQNVSREWFDFVRNRMRENLSHMDSLVNSRTPHEFWAAHSNLVRDNLEEFVHSARRMAEISVRVAEEAAQKMTNTSIAPQ